MKQNRIYIYPLLLLLLVLGGFAFFDNISGFTDTLKFSLGIQTNKKIIPADELYFKLNIQSAVGGVPLENQETAAKEIIEYENSISQTELPKETDSDGDGIPDEWEGIYFEKPEDNSTLKVQMRIQSMVSRGEEQDMPRLQQVGEETRADSDGDGISDFGEYKGGTNPMTSDSDQDGIKDGLEIIFKTDPKRIDSDSDCFLDTNEIAEKTDPSKADSKPKDENSNCVSDEYEQKYSLTYTDNKKASDNDTDEDGISDKYEYQLATNPTNKDSDDDGILDYEEVLDFNTDPLKKDDLKYIGLKITNWHFKEKTPDAKPLFKGLAKEKTKIKLFIDDNKGKNSVIGEAQSSDNGRFIIRPENEIQNGFYSFFVQEIDDKNRVLRKSNRVQLTIDSKLTAPEPKLEEFDGKNIFPRIEDLQLTTINNKPVITGRVFGGSKVETFWHSLLLSSSVLVDYDGEKFLISPPEPLTIGEDHTASVYAIRREDNLRSEDVDLGFRIEPGEEKVTEIKYPLIAGGLFLFIIISYLLWKHRR